MKRRFVLPKRGAHSTDLFEKGNNSFASPYSLSRCFALSRAAHSTEFFCFVKLLFSAPFLSLRLLCITSGRCALYMPKHSGQALFTDLLQENYKSLKSQELQNLLAQSNARKLAFTYLRNHTTSGFKFKSFIAQFLAIKLYTALIDHA